MTADEKRFAGKQVFGQSQAEELGQEAEELKEDEEDVEED